MHITGLSFYLDAYLHMLLQCSKFQDRILSRVVVVVHVILR